MYKRQGEWKALTTGAVDEKRPPARWMHSAVTIEQKMYVFGGCSETFAAMEDTWVFDGAENEWERVEPIGFPPTGALAALGQCHTIQRWSWAEHGDIRRGVKHVTDAGYVGVLSRRRQLGGIAGFFERAVCTRRPRKHHD